MKLSEMTREIVTRLSSTADVRGLIVTEAGIAMEHDPARGANAYRHIIYAGLRTFEYESLLVDIPAISDIRGSDIYMQMNGARLFSGDIIIAGYVDRVSRDPGDAIGQPISLSYGNCIERPAGLCRDEVVVGHLVREFENGLLVVNRAGEMWAADTGGIPLGRTWPSFEAGIFGLIEDRKKSKDI
jgi:hypothetical protein